MKVGAGMRRSEVAPEGKSAPAGQARRAGLTRKVTELAAHETADRPGHLEPPRAFRLLLGFRRALFRADGQVDCTAAQAEAKRLGVSFFLYYLYHALQAANEVELRYRIEDGQVYLLRPGTCLRHPGPGRPHLCLLLYRAARHLAGFVAAAQAEIAAVQASTGLRLSDATARPDVHCSAIPWVRFTGLSHARSFRHPDSCPKISFGQLFQEGAPCMPVSVNVHHGLGDGYHVGLFLAAFQRRLE